MGIYRQKKGGNWYVDYTDARGKRVRKAIGPSKREAMAAQKAFDERERQKRAGLLPMVDNEVPVEQIKDAYLAHLGRNRSANTYKMAAYALKTILPPLGGRTVADIRAGDVEAFISKQRGSLSERTVGIMVEGLNAMLNWAVRQGTIASNPVKDVERLAHPPSRRRRALTRDEVQRLLEKSPERYRPIWFAFLTTGLRRSELVELRWKDVDLEAGELRVRPEVAKTRKGRSIPMPGELRAALADMREGRTPEPQEHVFVNGAGRPWRNNLLKRLKKCLGYAGISAKGVDLHALRYTYGTLLYHNGVDIKTLQGLMGHASAKMTMDIYVKEDENVKARAVERLPFLKDASFTSYAAEGSRKERIA